MSLAQLYAILFKARWSILLMAIVGAAVAAGLSSTQPSQYQAKARVMLDIGDADPNQFSALRADTAGAFIGTEIRLVGDDAVTRDVVTKLGWVNDPGLIATWEKTTGGSIDVTTWAAHELAAGIQVHQFEDSAILEIIYTASSINAAKEIAGALRSAYIDNNLRLRVTAAQRASVWNRSQAAAAKITMDRALAGRIKFIADNKITIDNPNGSLEMRARTGARNRSITPPAGPRLIPVNTPAIQGLRSRLSALESQIGVTLAERGPGNPGTIAMTAMRDQAREQLARAISFAEAGANASAAEIETDRQRRSNDYLTARLDVLDRAPLYDRLAAIDREIELRLSLYQAAMQRVTNFDHIAAAPTGLRVIGDIIANDDAVFPNVPLSALLGGALSFGLGIALAMLGEMLRRPVRGVEDLRFFAKVPVLAVIAENVPQRSRRRLLFRRLSAATDS